MVLRTAGRAVIGREPMRAGKSSLGGHVIHDVDGAGPIYAAAISPDGRRYFSDEHRHRVVVEESSGYRWSFGTLGSGAGELRHPRGLDLLPAPTPADSRLFVCDAWNHRVQAFDGNGRFCFAFGCPGSGAGQFDVPSDVAVVKPRFAGEDADDDDAGTAWLAVADRWNNRVQVFESDGTFVGSVGGTRAAGAGRASLGRAGWPFFRLGPEPALWFPVRLAWKDERLEVVSASGLVLRIDLASAMLPDFDTWRRRATVADLRAARAAFAAAERTDVPPPDVLAAIDTDLGIRQIEADRWDDAARAWARPWPGSTPARSVERQLLDRVDALERQPPARHSATRTALVRTLASRADVARRLLARRAAAESLVDERDRFGDPFYPDRHARSLAAYAQLSSRLSVLARVKEPEAQVAWCAPQAAGDLRQAAVGHGVLAVVAGREPAVWLFDAHCAPLARFSLPAGTWPHGIAAAPDRGWYVTDVQHDCVFQLSEAGRIVRVWGGRGDGPDRLHHPLGLAAFDGRLLVADRDNDRVEVYDGLAAPLGAYPRLGAPAAVVFDGRTLWVSEWRRPQLRRIDPATGATLATVSRPDIVSPSSLAMGGRLVLAADYFGAAVHAFDLRGRWRGRLWRAGQRPMGRLSGIAVIRGFGVAVDSENGHLLRFALPRRAGAWQRNWR